MPCWSAAAFALIFVFTACTSISEEALLSAWHYTDLRLLDPPDASVSTNDLVAVYMRSMGENLQVRLDLLEPAQGVEYDLYLAFDLQPGGSDSLPIQARSQILWDTLLVVPARGSILLKSASGIDRSLSQALALHDPDGASVLVDLHRQSLEDRLAGFPLSHSLRLQTFLTSPGASNVMDQTGVASLDGSPPEPARVLLTFWSAYPAFTPASALRRWDGAHTGPSGGRHGLYNLLRAAKATKTPLILLDLNQPSALSALDYTGGLPLVLEMQRGGLLLLPASLPDSKNAPFQVGTNTLPPLLDWSSQVAEEFGLSDQGFAYLPRRAPTTSFPERRVFIPVLPEEMECGDGARSADEYCGALSPQRWRGSTLFPLYDFSSEEAATNQQAGRAGLSSEWKRILLSAALESTELEDAGGLRYINLGGLLPASTWGEPESARATLRWLQEHPWVQVLSPHDLRASSGNASRLALDLSGVHNGAQIGGTEIEPGAALAQALAEAPLNSLSQAALQAYAALCATVYPYSMDLPELRANYVGQVWSLLEAAKWAESPISFTTCQADPDRDGEPECILASESVYAQLEIDNGSLSFLFVLDSGDDLTGIQQAAVHQLIGPGSQFITGMSDPASWELQSGLRADPHVIPGAFSGPETDYQAQIASRGLRFTRLNGEYQRVYQLTVRGISMDIHKPDGASGEPLKIPLALDPWLRFSSGWADRYSSRSTGQSYEWEIPSHAIVGVSTSSSLTAHDFRETRFLFGSEEDPNLDYPAGHYLPFPLALLEVENQEDFRVTISLLNAP